MANQEETRDSKTERKRSYLFLSMILLVWNLIASGSMIMKEGLPVFSNPSTEISFSSVPGSLPAQTNISESRGKPLATPSGSGPGGRSLSLRQEYLLGKTIDINTATVEEFNSLPGISDAMAEAIIKERQRLGGFSSPNDLMRVKGIKEKRLEKILPFLKK